VSTDHAMIGALVQSAELRGRTGAAGRRSPVNPAFRVVVAGVRERRRNGNAATMPPTTGGFFSVSRI
jgi:hypothetical protein